MKVRKRVVGAERVRRLEAYAMVGEFKMSDWKGRKKSKTVGCQNAVSKNGKAVCRYYYNVSRNGKRRI